MLPCHSQYLPVWPKYTHNVESRSRLGTIRDKDEKSLCTEMPGRQRHRKICQAKQSWRKSPVAKTKYLESLSIWITTCQTEKTSSTWLQKAELEPKGNFTEKELCANKTPARLSISWVTEWAASPGRERVKAPQGTQEGQPREEGNEGLQTLFTHSVHAMDTRVMEKKDAARGLLQEVGKWMKVRTDQRGDKDSGLSMLPGLRKDFAQTQPVLLDGSMNNQITNQERIAEPT